MTHNVLRRALKQALRWGLDVRNVCDAVDPPRVGKTTISPLTTAEASILLRAASGDRLEALYVMALTTGLRQGGLFALKWPNVDLMAGTVTLQHTLLDVNGKYSLGEPKSAKSRRRVELPSLAVEALHDHRKRMLAEGRAGSEWVFGDTAGNHLRKSNFIRREFKPLLKAAGLPAIRFHELRHTSATLMLSVLSEGVHPKIVQERLGHSMIGLTMDTYSHVMPGDGA